MNAIPVSDKDLVGQILAGRREAFSLLVERHLHSALAIARARLLNPADADDAVQEAFLRAFKGLPTLREPAKFGPWLLTIARHEAVRLVAKGRSTLGADPATAPEASADPDPMRHELHELLRDHIAKLPDQAREVLLLHYFAGRSTREIATLLEVRQGAVLKRLQRAREQLAGTMLADLEAARPSEASRAKQIARIITLAAAVPAATRASASVATTLGAAPFLKARIFVAACASACLTVAIGWLVLNAHTLDSIQPANTETSSPLAAPAPVVTGNAASVETKTSPATDPATSNIPDQPVQLAQTERDTAPAVTPAATPEYPNATGEWEVSLFISDLQVENRLGRANIKDLGAKLEFLSEDDMLRDFNGEMSRTGDEVKLALHSPGAVGTLSGKFDEGFTELVLNGRVRNLPDADTDPGSEPLSMNVKFVAKRAQRGQMSNPERVLSLRRDLEILGKQLSLYLSATGDYPTSLDDLHPDYVADLAPYRSTATRAIKYRQPSARDEAAIQRLTRSASAAASAQNLMTIEEQLIALWGDRFMGSTAIVDVRDTQLDVHMQLRTPDRVVEVENPIPNSNDLSASSKLARQQFQSAMCANSLKQLGLCSKNFQGAQQHKLMPAGWRSLYPEFISGTSILTCPGDAPGTESYELLFPGATQEWLLALARTVKKLPADAPEAALTAAVPFLIEKHPCSGLDARNVLFLDGHVTRVDEIGWAADVAPFLAYR